MRRKASRISRVGRYAVNTMLVLFILSGLAWLLPSVVGYDRYVITGGSMSGTFEIGSLAIEKQVPVEELEVGDVITYMPPPDSGVTNLVTHRIATMTPTEDGRTLFQTKGDANADIDPWKFMLQQDTQPVVAFTIPKLGYAFIALANPTVRLLMLGVPAAIIALLALGDLVAALRPRRTAAPTTTVTPGATGPDEVGTRRRLKAVSAA
ncbi:MAG TPA: signal peptidase I [Nocardioidaceae bacterium]|nr:signal peptidase I [Nocardioidaceae bacterium]